MKLSQLKLEDVLHYGIYSSEQAIRSYICKENIDKIKEKLTAKFGDVDIEIDHKNKEVNITSENWLAAHKEYNARVQAWCDKYGCD